MTNEPTFEPDIPEITHQELEDVISKYMRSFSSSSDIIAKELAQEIMNYLAKKLNP